MAKDEEDDLLPDKDAAKGFYAKYEPKEILGRGISSTVRRCIEKETGKEFAAKIIDLGATTEAGETNPYHMLEATRQEISILRQVMGHPYIIDLQDVFESDAFVFLVFELCPKGELFDYLTSVVTLSEKKTRTIMRQIFEGVEYIHAKSIVHRDLKPENILLDENHNVKITDFGFARQLHDGEKLTDLCGTPGYLAPETLKCNMFEGSPGYSQEVDIWACGVIMFTLLVGCPPFWHRKQMVMLRNIMEGKYSFTSPEWADISEDPKDLIRKCLVVDPAQRITVKEVLRHPFFNQMVLMNDLTMAWHPPAMRQHSQTATTSSRTYLNHAIMEPTSSSSYSGKNNSSYIYYSAPQSSYSSNRLRDVALSPDAERQQQLQQQQQQQLQQQQVLEAATAAAAAVTAATSSLSNTGSSSMTLTATVYYSQQQQQQQQASIPAISGDIDNDKLLYANAKQQQQQQQAHLLYPTVQLRKQSRFNARKKFQFAILVIRAVIRIRRLRYTAEPLHVEEAIRDPYRVKVLRKVIDGCAFRVYGHWVKKGEGQNRAALFENTPRTELHALYINNLSR
ncbi:phosphorylase b kinase gamma catalytic chain, skeletal muscle/heart isoform isoform X1 [Drosophila nasuta]|uniref:phosphorylase b kinase gamma catalytic chain, skeletal muscle/heart isoform isoform X1 n=1 Tax=Drosophila nasuta TaxID=42062 RepID=UPI00295ED2DA|nr:phosphorylase b kinase gamma catalytic chain, skeletal muscle/heart isoform isoform X1 [Drosophila nasuta]XP_060662294.1 phosphorylase b kinase gamma catalytic chain, skeletal muscle/heart isoform isoform X1 [Drosophila nasuta]XP_060662295.1 phosphorylase b kinase gamma catalytic chain, skeletal muscle/heart isoform isoform X1 [Drosophila nasuta]XP_060662296.1 phosphorylase b kinase gamma catalytic chain, skeletal muscle/heart isoform isoform X1 [Drosophila nasuta]XP_060662297.1 phosphorylas